MDFVDQLKSQLDIVEVVGQYVRLKRAGAGPRFVGLCPFHTEKTPSFGVHSTQQFYKCFGCDARGDLIKFVMEIEGLTFWETLKLLSERYGIPMPQRQSFDDPAARLRESLFEMHEAAATVFARNLHASGGAEARRYLEQRGVSRESIEEFRLGLADPRGQQLVQQFDRFGPELMEESGLIVKRQEGGGYYDRFRGRLIFPIHNESGKVIAFGGRALGATDLPKYLNSPETKIYKKSFVLYNLHRARAQARKLDRMILVEGYMDVIGVYSAGIQNVVASCGTSLTGEQVRAIKRQIAQTEASAGQIVVNFDPDDAGSQAAERSIQMLLAEGLRVKVLHLTGGLDPDEFIKQNGAEQYLKIAGQAPSYFHWLADRARSRFDMQSAEGRVQAFQFLWPSLQRVHDKLERAALVNEISSYLGIDPQLIREQFRRSSPDADSVRRVVEISSALSPNERLLALCVLHSAEAREAVLHFLEHSGIPAHFQLAKMFDAMLAMQRGGSAFSLDALLDRLEPRDQKLVAELSFHESGLAPESATSQALNCLHALEAGAIDVRRAELKRLVRQAEHEGNMPEALRLADELKRIENERTDRRGQPA